MRKTLTAWILHRSIVIFVNLLFGCVSATAVLFIVNFAWESVSLWHWTNAIGGHLAGEQRSPLFTLDPASSVRVSKLKFLSKRRTIPASPAPHPKLPIFRPGSRTEDAASKQEPRVPVQEG